MAALVVGIVAASVAATAVPSWPAAPGLERTRDDGSVVVSLHPYAGRLVTVPVLLGREKLTLLLDTGGGQTLITPRVAARIGCEPSGRRIGFRMTGERVTFEQCATNALEIGGRRFVRTEIAVWDVMSVLPKELPPLDGVLALDTLGKQPFTLDLAARTLTLESARTLERRVATMTRVPARIATGIGGEDLTLLVRAVLDKPGWFLFDSGNLDATYVAPHMVPRGVAPASRLDSVALSLDGLPARKVALGVRDVIYDGVLAEEFLRQFVWTFRLASGDVWAAAAR